MFENLKLRSRLWLGYAVSVVLFLILTAVVYGTSNQVLDTLKEVDRVQTVILDVNKVTLDGEKMVRSFSGYLAVQNEMFIQEYNAASNKFEADLKSLDRLIIVPEQKERLDKIMAVKNNFQSFADKVIELALKEGKQTEAIDLFKTKANQEFIDKIERLSQDFYVVDKTLLAEEKKETKKNLILLRWCASIEGIFLIVISIITTITIIGNTTKKLQVITDSIANVSTEIYATINQQERTTAQQASAVNETTTTMEQLAASSQGTAEQAEAGAVAARKALNLSEEGTKSVDKSLEGMNYLSEKVGVISQQITRLNEQINQIGNISQAVGDLANQTNMLALNAAVEAVRAGENGKGFGVVASEIRKLADESRKSAEKIYTLVADIQTSINSTVLATEAGTENVELGVKSAEETTAAFNGIKDAINNVVLNNQRISLNAQQQSLAIQQLGDAMNDLNRGAREIADGLGPTQEAIQKLNEVRMELNSIV
ncbi:hypothetical protein AFK68_08680 [Hydrocoleum sp. CS-953]|uniref:HAMP domain-containing methyl-accepting chemotaxis protein n=1 Tax=Hydrocoleum sp. CS-953 TaxID=1671698 RepID=UPI000B9C4439|nr:methyl-accepting chemotaxis protein [Hydrocoleum sp. CS-953]OZH54795.1 hypothetical protein AFK68_08680 [Hydrocoleum sp. CS-953]